MQLLAYLAVYPFIWFISILPFRLLYALSDFLCFLIYRVIGYRTKVVRRNLTLTFPEKTDAEIKEIEKRFYSHMCDLFLEMVKTLTISKKEISKRFTFKNIDLFKQYEDQNRSIMLMAGHYASYEWLVSMASQMNHEGYVIYAPLSNKYFDKLVQRIRKKHGVQLVSRYDTMKLMRKHQKEGTLGVYGFANDQSPQPHKTHYWRKFLGITVPVHTNAERIAKDMNLVVMFIDIQKVKRGYYQATFKLITEAPDLYPDYEITDIFTEMLEEQIREKPEYYLWTHNRFKHSDKVPAKFKS
ncbi:lysophospholipid acyltransferase family protein [Robertkochia aurantiaca]|uniref:lysophospholipid acyltransferase family protein n=1 Tax=Robertkochia aurantiaca TaxID=2873700 RepID=UPI001CCF364E|nr:lysophospholipid acyltransferase family protein [Robertkochia sp. 3YJGBD-33]